MDMDMYIGIEQKIEAIRASITHWNEMIQWVKDNITLAASLKRPVLRTMREALGQAWTGDFCPLCALFRHASDCLPNCELCPLKSCAENSAWRKVSGALTWQGWIQAAETQMLPKLTQVLASLEDEYAARQDKTVRFPEPPAGEQWNNPGKLSAEQVGIQDGWRLLLKSEIEAHRNLDSQPSIDNEDVKWNNPDNLTAQPFGIADGWRPLLSSEVEAKIRPVIKVGDVELSSVDGISWKATVCSVALDVRNLNNTYRTKLSFEEFRKQYLSGPRKETLDRINQGNVTANEFSWLRNNKVLFVADDGADYFLAGTLSKAMFVCTRDHTAWSFSPWQGTLKSGRMRLEKLPDWFPVTTE